jgi:hypothetical protein
MIPSGQPDGKREKQFSAREKALTFADGPPSLFR